VAARTRRLFLERSFLLVLLIGLSATAAGFLYSAGNVKRNDQLLLRQEAGQGSVVLGSFLSQYQQTFLKLGDAVTEGPGSQPAFVAAAAQVAKQGSRVALLRHVGSSYVVVAGVGVLHRKFGGPDDAALAAMIGDGQVHYPAIASDAGERWIEQIVGPPEVPVGFALYWELPTSPVVSLGNIPGLPFSGIDAAVYLGAERPADLVFASTRTLPVTGTRAVVRVSTLTTTFPVAHLNSHPGSATAPGSLLLVVRANKHLSGAWSAVFPWVLLLVGVAATVAVAYLLSVSTRRRDEALRLVHDMKDKHVELDQALRRQAEAEEGLRQAQRLEAVGQLAGGIAHDFNNLLHVILSYTDFLERAVEPDSPLREDVLEVQGAAQRAAELTRQLLVFARGEVVRPSLLDANHVLRDSELLLRHTLGEDIDLRIGIGAGDCTFVADLGEIKQVLMNLAINARDAMPRGGTLRIDVGRVEVSEHNAPSMGLVPGAHVRVDMTDTGIGMPREVANRAFEPFFTTKETGRGTGLGLSMVYGIVARWHGFVSISSSPGRGTTVTMLFPVAIALPVSADPDSALAGPSAPPPAVPQAHGKTLLLVEDQEQVRRSMARILESAGYHVVQAGDALEARRRYADEHVDLLLTDIVMPGGRSGKELADELWEMRPDLPVVFATGYGTEEIAVRGVLPATMTLIEKPFTAQTLLRTVGNVLHDAVSAS